MTVVTIDNARKRHEIELEYQACLKAWQEQYEVTIRLVAAERDVKCHVAKCLRDQKLLELDGLAEPQWPGWA